MSNIQNKEIILKSAKEKGHVTYKARPNRIISNLFMETVKARQMSSRLFESIDASTN